MLSLNKSNRPIAIIKGGEDDKQIIYLHDTLDKRDAYHNNCADIIDFNMFSSNRKNLKVADINKILDAIENGYEIEDIDLSKFYNKAKNEYDGKIGKELIIYDGQFQIMPSNIPNQRECLYISAPSGAGKSTFASNYCRAYKKMFPHNRIFLFSKKTEDEVFDKLPYIQRIILDEGFGDGEPLDCNDLQNSLCVFDDIENIREKFIKDAVYKLKDNLLETGRSANIYVCICNHIAMNYKETKIDINESTAYVFFKNGNNYHTQRYLKEYIGLTKDKINRLMDMPSRWIMVNKTYPMYAVSENEIILL